MAVAEQTPYIEYTANGATTSFALGFYCESKDHLIVTVNGVEPLLTDWSLVDGAVVFAVAPINESVVVIQRNTPFSRPVDYQTYNNSFRAPAVNNDFDRIWLKLQELGTADWILRQYVDKKDNELKAFLLAEIQAQGVALDQLDEYYNYLMQRLAQIAVDKGWDASFVVDGDKNQHQINQEQMAFNASIGKVIGSIEALRNIDKTQYSRAFVTGYHTTNDGGGGQYYLDVTDTASTDNSGTIIIATDGGRWKFVENQQIYAETFGAKGDGTTDDTAAIKAAIAWVSSKNGGDVHFKSKVYAISDSLKVEVSAVGLIGEGAESYLTGDFGTTLKWVGNTTVPMVWFNLLDSPRFKNIALDCANKASGIHAQGVKFGTFENFAIRDFLGVGFYGLCGSVAGQWSNGNTVHGFIITSQNSGVKGLMLDGVIAANNDWWGNVFSRGIVQVYKTTPESHAGHLAFCDSNTFQEVDFSVAQFGDGVGIGVLFNGGSANGYPQNNNFYGCSIFSTAVYEPVGNKISNNFFFAFPQRDMETLPNHPNLIGFTDNGEYFGSVFTVKRDTARIRLSPNTADRSYDVILNASDSADYGIQVSRRVAGVDKIIFKLDQNGDPYVWITGVGLRQVVVGAADSAGAGYRTLRIAN